MKKISENASCSMCLFRGELEGDYFKCTKKGNVKPYDVCRKYTFDPFSKRPARQRRFDTSMFDPLDFDINQ
ncbi:MAG: hypothetical protein IJ435_01585 [Clostridia bacterium]|nr:hypothetical protein [Clostridia bacterium]